jgi:hypothetical protein
MQEDRSLTVCGQMPDRLPQALSYLAPLPARPRLPCAAGWGAKLRLHERRVNVRQCPTIQAVHQGDCSYLGTGHIRAVDASGCSRKVYATVAPSSAQFGNVNARASGGTSISWPKKENAHDESTRALKATNDFAKKAARVAHDNSAI